MSLYLTVERYHAKHRNGEIRVDRGQEIGKSNDNQSLSGAFCDPLPGVPLQSFSQSMSLDRLSLEHAATDGSRDPLLRAATKVGAARLRQRGGQRS